MKWKWEKGMVDGDVDVRSIPDPRRFKFIQNEEGTNMVQPCRISTKHHF